MPLSELSGTAESGLPDFQSFVAGVEKDKDAVQAGLTWPINNGIGEGDVTKLNLTKQQMYGKAGFALLRQCLPLHQFHFLTTV